MRTCFKNIQNCLHLYTRIPYFPSPSWSGVAHLSSEGYVGGGECDVCSDPDIPIWRHVHTRSHHPDSHRLLHRLLPALGGVLLRFLLLLHAADITQRRAKNSSCSLDREDATFRRSSASPSLGNTIWGRLQILFVCFSLLMYFSSLYLLMYLLGIETAK